MSILGVLIAAVAAAAAAVGLIHVKVKTSSVLTHHDTHRRQVLAGDAMRAWVQLLGVLTLTTPFEEYWRVHEGHHANDRFATMRDEEAAFLHGLGFQPGTPRAQSWRFLWRSLFAPRLHARLVAQRLQMNFLQGKPQRRRLAWLVWSGLLAGSTLGGVLPGLVLGVLLPLLLGGNVGSLLELVSRHRWLVTPVQPHRRQFELSHARLPAPQPPERGGPAAWAGWTLQVAAAVLARLTIVPADLSWHLAHHSGQRRAEGAPAPAWVDAASVYSKAFWDDPRLQAQSHGSILAAIDAWFVALATEERD